MKILGIDYGSKRVGIAISNEAGQFAMPVSVIENGPTLMSEVVKLIIDHEAKEVVLGESKNYKGEPNDIMIDILDFKRDLEAKGYSVHFEPEFMTSVQAERIQGKNSLSDASAAALILQSYLDKQHNDHL